MTSVSFEEALPIATALWQEIGGTASADKNYSSFQTQLAERCRVSPSVAGKLWKAVRQTVAAKPTAAAAAAVGFLPQIAEAVLAGAEGQENLQLKDDEVETPQIQTPGKCSLVGLEKLS